MNDLFLDIVQEATQAQLAMLPQGAVRDYLTELVIKDIQRRQVGQTAPKITGGSNIHVGLPVQPSSEPDDDENETYP